MTEATDVTAARLSRRGLVWGLGVAAAAAAGGTAYVAGAGFLWQPDFAGSEVTPEEALELAEAGRILLVDIRRPDEWAATGIGAPATPLDMRREDFIEALSELVDGKRETPIALICARGVRSARQAKAMDAAGFTRIIDVPEGMLGSRAGPGWLKRGLPTRVPS